MAQNGKGTRVFGGKSCSYSCPLAYLSSPPEATNVTGFFESPQRYSTLNTSNYVYMLFLFLYKPKW